MESVRYASIHDAAVLYLFTARLSRGKGGRWASVGFGGQLVVIPFRSTAALVPYLLLDWQRTTPTPTPTDADADDSDD